MYFPLLNIHFKNFLSNSIERICSYSIQQFEHRGRPPDEHVLEYIFLTSHPQYVVGTQKNHLNEMVLLHIQNTRLNSCVVAEA